MAWRQVGILWNSVNLKLENKFWGNLKRKYYIFVQEDTFGYVVSAMGQFCLALSVLINSCSFMYASPLPVL